MVISAFSFIPLILLNDDRSIGSESEGLAEIANNDSGSYDQSNEKRNPIPYLLVASNVIIGFGAGMTIKFFAIFFLEVYTLSPIPVNAILGSLFIFTGLSSVIAQKLSLKRGRARMIFTVQMIATACLFLLAFYPPILIMVPIFLARGSLMNSSQPLSRSILMVNIPKNRRGFWNSLETIAWGLFWNVSAVLGGFLIEIYSYRVCFLITASVYVLGILPILVLIPLVSHEKGSKMVNM